MRKNVPCEGVVLPQSKPHDGPRDGDGQLTRLTIKDIEVMTPMLGGGASQKVTDKDMPIRATAIRGQLRFWWRTFQPSTSNEEAESIRRLKEKEDAIWGSTEKASTVSVSVESVSIPSPPVCYAEDNRDLPQYVLFPLREEKKDKQTNDAEKSKNVRVMLYSKVRFALRLEFQKKDAHDVLNAVRLWILFGGVGSRTRRGMGSLCVRSHADKTCCFGGVEDVHRWLDEILQPNEYRIYWPSLFGARLVLRSCDRGRQPDDVLLSAWMECVGIYQKFRQFRLDKEAGTYKKYGVSAWPEPKSLDHLVSSKDEEPPKFPRGALGLPIVFHFPYGKHSFKGIDGDVSFKYSCKTDRFSSPLIIKALCLNASSYAQCFLLLHSPFPKADLTVQEMSSSDKRSWTLPSGYDPRSNPNIAAKPLEGKAPYDAFFFRFEEGERVLGQGGRS